MNKVFIVGGATFNSIIHLNHFPEPKGQTIKDAAYHETVGSTGIGKALNLKKLGFDTTLHGMIGDDIYGDRIKDYLEKEKINFIYDIDPLGTERHVNLMDENGDRISIFIANGSFNPEIELERLEKLIFENEIIILNIVNYTKGLIQACKNNNKEIWTDLHDYDGVNPYYNEYIDAADYIFLSSISLKDYKKTMQDMSALGKKLIVCTHGDKGSTALTMDGRWIDVPALNDYQQNDTNGAGDSFFAGFLYGYIKGYAIEKCMRYGAIVGGLTVTSKELSYDKLSEDLVESEYLKYYDN